MDKEKMNNDPQNTSEEITERIEEMIEEETETGAGTVSISDRLREAEADENDYDADVEDGYDEAEYDEADGEVDGENEYGEASEDAEYVEDKYSEEEEEEDDDDEPRIVVNPKVVKVASLILFSGIILVFASIAWFTMNREVGTSGMGVKVAGMPYIIETRSGSGTYKTQYDSLNTQGEEWKISAEHNLENHSGAIEEGEEEPGLEPGDHGSLEFRVSPQNSDTITVDCLFEVKAYLETKVKDEDENETTIISVINDSVLTGYLEGHIMLFAGYDEETGKYTGLIDNNNANLQRILTNKTYTKGEAVYTTIYWCWPEHLSDLTGDVTGSANIIYDPDEHEAVIAYIARNKDKFFKDCNDSNAKVLTDLTNLYNTYTNQTYNHYNLKYDNADLIIGNNISYVMLSMQVIND